MSGQQCSYRQRAKYASLPSPHRLPGRLNVRIQVLLGRLATTHAVAGVIVAKDVAVDLRAEGQVEATHLAKVHGVPVGEEQRVLGVLAAPDIDAGNQVATRRAREEGLHFRFLPLGVLPLGAVKELQVVPDVRVIRRSQLVRGLRRLEGQLGRNGAGAWWAAEHAAQLAYTEHAR